MRKRLIPPTRHPLDPALRPPSDRTALVVPPSHGAAAIGAQLRATARSIAGTVLALTFAMLALGPAVAQPTEIHGQIKGEGGRRIPIAIPATVAPAGPLAAPAAEIQQTLIDDLAYSGYFEIIPTASLASLPPIDPGNPQMTPWRATGAEAVVAMRAEPQGDQIALAWRLYGTTSPELLLGKRYASDRDLARLLAHRIASEITAHFTGQTGVSLSRIAFVSKHGPGKEVYAMDYDGQRIRRLTTTGTINLSPVWSPDGTRLAFLSFRQRQPSLYILQTDGTITRLPMAGGDLNSAPSWSPDGKRIAFSSSRDGNSEIYVMDIATGRERRMTENPAIDTSPAWSPTGRELAFTSDRTGSPQLYVMDAEGGSARRLTFEGAYNESACWSPREGRIVYVSRIEGKFALMLYDIAAQKSTRLLGGPFNCEDPHWSPDGRHIAFASDKDGAFQIYTIDADGSNLRRLTRGEPSFTPDWSR